LPEVFGFQNLLASFAGVVFGLIVGVLPGLTVSLGMIILLPLTFNMSTEATMGMLLGLYQAGMTGGSISAIFLNIPGTPAAAATLIDGHPMAMKGEGERAVKTAIISSFCGGLIGLFFLVLISPLLAQVALQFGAPEQFSIILLGLALISGLAGKSMLKGILAGLFGLIIGTIGMDPLVGTPRFTFHFVTLKSGIHWLPVMLGAFAIPVIIEGSITTGVRTLLTKSIAYPPFMWISDFKRCLKNIIIGGVIGTWIGAIPGANAPVATFLTYDFCQRRAKNRKEYGTGIPEGVAGPEASNNAVAGGAMIPLLTLGIPGDTVTAVLLGAFVIHGLSPGPMFFQQHPQMVYSIFWLFLLAILMTFIIVTLSSRWLARICETEKYLILPIIVVLCVVGSYVYRNNFFDVAVMLFFGIFAFFMKKADFPIVPMILAIILGTELEKNVRLSIILGGGTLNEFFSSPIALSFLFFALLIFISPFFRGHTGWWKRLMSK